MSSRTNEEKGELLINEQTLLGVEGKSRDSAKAWNLVGFGQNRLELKIRSVDNTVDFWAKRGRYVGD